ncbi:MAG: hypothetical protein KTR31_12365 [Myxococcales bacterium]|nr:hypothetical protein [Myxococcales bacterium]
MARDESPDGAVIEQMLHVSYTADGMRCELPGPGSVGPAALLATAMASMLSVVVFRMWAVYLVLMGLGLLAVGAEWSRRSLMPRVLRIDGDELKLVHLEGQVLARVDLSTVHAVSLAPMAVQLHRIRPHEDTRIRSFLGRRELQWLVDRIAEAARLVHRARGELERPEHVEARRRLDQLRTSSESQAPPHPDGKADH